MTESGPVITPSPVAKPDVGVITKIISLKCNETCTDSERKELPGIEDAMNETLASKCFEDYIKSPGRRLDYTKDTPDQIVKKMRIPTELTLDYYYQRSAALGYESADDFSVIHFNRRNLGGWTKCDKASLGAHELSHSKGYFHMGNRASPNYYSVPYQINHAFDQKSYDDYNGGCCKE